MWCEERGRGGPIMAGGSLGFFCFKSVLQLRKQRPVFSSLSQKTDPWPQHCPMAFLVRPGPTLSLTAKSSSPCVPLPSPCSHQTQGSQAADVQPAEAQGWCQRAGSSGPLGHLAWATSWPPSTHCAGQVSRLPRPCQTSAALS